ncbi:MAG: FliG C-terminal domain-containing protein, partial [Bacteriovoracaceae bacterium]
QGYHGMTVGEQEALYKKLTKEEDKHVEELRTNIESLEQLEYLTKSMKIKLFQEMKVSSLAIALRLCRKFVIISLIKDISENLREEFIYEIQHKQPLSKVIEVQKQLLKYISEKEKSGDIYLDSESFNKEV